MQGLVVVGLIFEEIPNVDVKCVKVSEAQNIGQSHQVKVSAESVHQGKALCNVVLLYVLYLRRYRTSM